MDLKELKRQRAQLDQQIAQAEKSHAEAMKEIALQALYVRVACPGCDGRGEVGRPSFHDNADIDVEDCDDCRGRGYLNARKFEGKKAHDMEYNEVTTA